MMNLRRKAVNIQINLRVGGPGGGTRVLHHPLLQNGSGTHDLVVMEVDVGHIDSLQRAVVRLGRSDRLARVSRRLTLLHGLGNHNLGRLSHSAVCW